MKTTKQIIRTRSIANELIFAFNWLKVFSIVSVLIVLIFISNKGYASVNNKAKIILKAGTYINVKGNLTNATNGDFVNNGILILSGDLVNNGILTANSAVSSIECKGNSVQHLNIGTYTNSVINNLKINNAVGVILETPLNTTTLTLTTGNLTTSTTNILTVVGTADASIIGGSATSFINGPLARTLPALLASGSIYAFPIGKSAFNLYEMMNTTTNAANTVIITAEVFDAIAGGTDGEGFNSFPNPNKYWKVEVTGSGILSAAGTIRLLAPNMNLSNNIIGCASSQMGIYTSVGGGNLNFPLNGNISSSIVVPLTLGYFKVGTNGCNTLAPTGDTIQSFNSGTIANLVVNGSNLIWYDAPSGGTVLPSSEILVDGTSYYASQTISGCESSTRLNVKVTLSFVKVVNIYLFLEGLYNSNTNTMTEAVNGETGYPQYGDGIADRIQIDLFEENAPYLPIDVSISGIDLSTSGLATFQISPTHNGNYYIRVRNRNHLEIWSAAPVPFSPFIVNYDFRTSALQAFGDNAEVQVSANPIAYAFLLGDLDQNGVVESLDFNIFEPELTLGSQNFNLCDFDGNGVVESLDFNLFEPRLTEGNSSSYPGKRK